jgi:hypothetical protein
MEKFLKELLDDGFSVSLYNDVEHDGSYFVDIRRNAKRLYTSVPKKSTEDFPNMIEVTIEQLSKAIRDKKTKFR